MSHTLSSATKELSKEQQDTLMSTLKDRFGKNKDLHPDFDWREVEKRLETHREKLWSLSEMESTGWEPDVVSYDTKTGEFIFFDCAAESPIGRRSFCYDHEALESRKENKPKNSAFEMAKTMGIELLTEEEYRELQTLGNFDMKTSSWVLAPASMRRLGGALFCDRRYERVFTYHNGAESYYAGRGFRGSLRV